MIRCIKGCVGPGGDALVKGEEYSLPGDAEKALIRMKRAVAIDAPAKASEQRETAATGAGRETAAAGARETAGAKAKVSKSSAETAAK
jgi:hypothetical protein